jgi:shikimate kinase
MNTPKQPTAETSNIILIGMPGSGKSTLGVQLAKDLGLQFLDTDILIQTQQQQCLQSIVDTHGYMALRAIEEQVLLSLNTQKTLIATGGSAIYSHKAMQHLQSLGTIVFLDVDLHTLESRINNEESRGIARPEGQSFTDLFAERTPLYQQYANIVYNNTTREETKTLIEQLHLYSSNT